MAGEFLRSHGVEIDAEMSRIQFGTANASEHESPGTRRPRALDCIHNVCLPSTAPGSRWTIDLNNGRFGAFKHAEQTHTSTKTVSIDGKGALMAPSLCHPHVHLDKAYLLSHPKYADLQIERGDFIEAMGLTGKAKSQFEHGDLLERGQRLIDESVLAGVTHMRAFVEVDAGVHFKCLDAGLELKKAAEDAERMKVQLCAFAQLPLFTPSQDDPDGGVIRRLVQEATVMASVECIGSTPYVEADREEMKRNVDWMIDLSAETNTHLDFHLDYNVDPNTEPMIWHVLKSLRSHSWQQRTGSKRTVVLGHCTRLTLFSSSEWQKLREEVGELPISFVGLPTSDLFMMRTRDRRRGTLDVPTLIKEHGLNACIGINNIGNAFTPQGSCDPLSLACQGVGVYQAGTKADAELLYECVSTRAREAIGMGREDGSVDLGVKEGDGGFVVFGEDAVAEWRTRRSVAEAVYLHDHCQGRRGVVNGRLTS
ncbi:Metallo-dependent hydrolase [Teratosphaeria destructans]|uniref:Metallo-dependent hydrolase n=1 Tax=Teratosphaeria destructans TaxID=418781 RepID=A0A9W7SSS2_9PEZI|nr:Metallo-dependent hydrolase [Teratosphaeria destructans]